MLSLRYIRMSSFRLAGLASIQKCQNDGCVSISLSPLVFIRMAAPFFCLRRNAAISPMAGRHQNRCDLCLALISISSGGTKRVIFTDQTFFDTPRKASYERKTDYFFQPRELKNGDLPKPSRKICRKKAIPTPPFVQTGCPIPSVGVRPVPK